MKEKPVNLRISGKWLLRGLQIWVMISIFAILFVTRAFTTHGVRAQVQALAPGDWPTYLINEGRSGFNSAETIINPSTAPNLKLHWSYKVGGAISSQPVEDNGLIYWGSWDGYERATHLDGTLAWAIFLGKETPQCFPFTGGGVASTATVSWVSINGTNTLVDFVGGGDGNFYALNATTGAFIWHTFLGAIPDHYLWSSPLLYNGSIYEGVASYGDCPLVQGQFVQLDATTGAIQHTFSPAPDGCLGATVWGSAAADTRTGMIYIATGNNGTCSTNEIYSSAILELRASDLSLVNYWQSPLGHHQPDRDFGSTPTLFDATINGVLHHMIGAANKDGQYYALDRTNLSQGPLWTDTIAISGACPECDQASISPSAWDGSTLYMAGGAITLNGNSCKGSVQAVNPATGAFLWQVCLTSGAVFGAVTVVPGLVVVTQGVYLDVLDASSGNILYSYLVPLKGVRFFGSASISNGVLYVGEAHGLSSHFYAFGL
jgi:outer membrane protein assembly factor BamB